MAIDSSQYNFMLSAGNTMADNQFRLRQEQRIRENLEYQRRQAEELQKQKEAALAEAGKQYKLRQQEAAEAQRMNFMLTGGNPSAGVPTYTMPPVAGKTTRRRNSAGIPTYTPQGNYVPSKADENARLMYLYRFDPKSLSDAEIKRVAGWFAPYTQRPTQNVPQTVLSIEGEAVLLDSGYTQEQLATMSNEEQISALTTILNGRATTTAKADAEAVRAERQAAVDAGNAEIERQYEENRLPDYTVDAIPELDIKIAALESGIEEEINRRTEELRRTGKGGRLENWQIAEIRKNSGVEELIALRKKLASNLDAFNNFNRMRQRPGLTPEFYSEMKQNMAEAGRNMKEARTGYNQNLVDKQFRRIPDVAPAEVTDEAINAEYRNLLDPGYFADQTVTEALPEDHPRAKRYQLIKAAADKGDYGAVYRLLPPEERQKLLPGYDPAKQREFNYRYPQYQKAEAERQKAEAQRKEAEAARAKALKEAEQKAAEAKTLQEFNDQRRDPAVDAVMYIRRGIPFSHLPKYMQDALRSKYTEMIDGADVNDIERDTDFLDSVIPQGYEEKYGKFYNRSANEIAPKLSASYEKGQQEKQYKTNLDRATEAARINNPFIEYKPTAKDINAIAALINNGMEPDEAAQAVFNQIEEDDKRSNPDREKQLKKGISTRVNKQLTGIFGAQFGRLEPEMRTELANQYRAWAALHIPQKTRQLIAKNVSEMSDEEIDHVIGTLTDASKVWESFNNRFDSPVAGILINAKKEKIKRKKTLAGDSDPAYMWHNKYPEYANGTLSYANLFPIIPEKDAEHPDARFAPENKKRDDESIAKAYHAYIRHFPMARQRKKYMSEIYDLFHRYKHGYKVTPPDYMSKEEKVFWTEVLPALTDQYRLNLLLDKERKISSKRTDR